MLGLKSYRILVGPMAVIWITLAVHGYSDFPAKDHLPAGHRRPLAFGFVLVPNGILWLAYGIRALAGRLKPVRPRILLAVLLIISLLAAPAAGTGAPRALGLVLATAFDYDEARGSTIIVQVANPIVMGGGQGRKQRRGRRAAVFLDGLGLRPDPMRRCKVWP